MADFNAIAAGVGQGAVNTIDTMQRIGNNAQTTQMNQNTLDQQAIQMRAAKHQEEIRTKLIPTEKILGSQAFKDIPETAEFVRNSMQHLFVKDPNGVESIRAGDVPTAMKTFGENTEFLGGYFKLGAAETFKNKNAWENKAKELGTEIQKLQTEAKDDPTKAEGNAKKLEKLQGEMKDATDKSKAYGERYQSFAQGGIMLNDKLRQTQMQTEMRQNVGQGKQLFTNKEGGTFEYKNGSMINMATGEPATPEEITGLKKMATDKVEGGKQPTSPYQGYRAAMKQANPNVTETEIDKGWQKKQVELIGSKIGAKSEAEEEQIKHYLKSPETKKMAKLFAEYRLPTPTASALRDPKIQAALSMATDIDPTFDETQYATRLAVKKDFMSPKGAAGKNILGLNTAVGHINSLVKASDDLGNTSWTSANAVANALAKHFPVSKELEDRQGKITAVKTKFNAVKDEMASIFKSNGATDISIKSWSDTIENPATATPKMWKAFIDGALELMGSRLDALKDRYEAGMGKAKDFNFLSANSRKILQGLGKNLEEDIPVNEQGGTQRGNEDSGKPQNNEAIMPRKKGETPEEYLARTSKSGG